MLDISVIICTRNRADSLRETLAALAAADRTGLAVEVVVVDNGSADHTQAVVGEFSDRLNLRTYVESTLGKYGKSHALNRALDAGGLGELVAILDDDMTVEANWWHGVRALSDRWPDVDLFSGRSYLVWPPGPIPAWAEQGLVQSWMFSVFSSSEQDHPQKPGQWYSGNHFWFRSRVLANGRRFPDTWFTEPQFQLQLVQEGSRGVHSTDAVVGHRIQPGLLAPEAALARATDSGPAFAAARLSPCRPTVANARMANKHPLLARIYCVAAWLGWSLVCLRYGATTAASKHFARRLHAIERRTNYRESLRILAREKEYSLSWRRPRPAGRRTP